MNEDQPPLRKIFTEAVEIADAQQRAAYLAAACGANAELRRKVEALLRAHEQAGGFLNPPVNAESGRSSTVPVVEPLTEKAGETIGRYKLLQQIGEGGCGVVYMAEQQEPVRRRVALKVIKLGMDTKQVIARFEAERQALALMDHPNIAKVLDAGATETGRPYFVMDLVPGLPITQFCDDANLSTRDRLELFLEVCSAIQHAHQKGIIHRDIKPSNVMVTLHGDKPVPKVIDFGIAKATAGQQLTDKTLFTAFEQFIGTPAYMSPEQASLSGLDIDTRSDIYALGVLLYELLTGKPPFDPQTLAQSGLDEIRRTIREVEPLKPSTRLSTMVEGELTTTAKHRRTDAPKLIHVIRGDLDWIVMKALEKDRARRYETANGLAMDIKRHLSDEPIVARPPSKLYRFQKSVRRNKLAFAAAGAVMATLMIAVAVEVYANRLTASAVTAMLVIGLGASIWLFLKEKRARQRAETEQQRAETEKQRAETEQQRADSQARKASESREQSRRLLYASDMNLAQQSLRLNNLGRARRLLDRHRPQPGEEDLRGWEWRYLWQLTRSTALVTLTNRPVRGFSVSFSPDGARLAVGWGDGHVDLWDVHGRRLVRTLAHLEYPHQGRVAFSPVRNLLAATSEPKVVALYDLDTGRESILWRAPYPGSWRVRDLSFSQDGSKVVIYAVGGTSGLGDAVWEHTKKNVEAAVGGTSGLGDAVWVVNVASIQIEGRYPTLPNGSAFHGAARLSPDNRHLYLALSDKPNYRYSIQCLDLATGKELWQTEPQRDFELTALAISPDGQVLASGSGFEDPTIRIWDAETGRLLARLDGHTAWVCKLVFSRDGRRLISAASDQTIRFWDTSSWIETKVLRGNTDEVHAVAISEAAQLLASASKDGNLMLWKEDATSSTEGYSRLPENLRIRDVLPLDQSRLLLLPPGKPPELVDLKRGSLPMSLPEIDSSTNILGWSGTNTLCCWDGTNQILVREWRGSEFIQRGAVTLDPGVRPTGAAYNAARQLLAWSDASSSKSVYLANLAAPDRRIELRNDVAGLVPFRFSEDGKFVAAVTLGNDSLRVWNVETGQIAASIDGRVNDSAFAAGGRVLVVAIEPGNNHEIRFYDLAHPKQAPRRVPGRYFALFLAVSPDGGLVASSTLGGQVRLFDPTKGELIESVHGHLNAAFGLAFSTDGRRLISGGSGREAVKLWDVGTRQELLTLGGTGSLLDAVKWSADGDVILAGAPWQAWRAPSWEEIEAAERAREGNDAIKSN
jgi:eukaryotic-like serine/threonine-protein kinase